MKSSRSKPVFAIRLIAAIFLLFCLLPHLDLPGDPNVRHLHLWPANRWFVGIGWQNAALGNVVISLFFMLGCIPPMLWLNTAGRRPLLIGSFADDAGAGGFGADPGYGDLAGGNGVCGVCLFSGGPGNLQWLYPNELFPTDIRASAVGVIMSLPYWHYCIDRHCRSYQ